MGAPGLVGEYTPPVGGTKVRQGTHAFRGSSMVGRGHTPLRAAPGWAGGGHTPPRGGTKVGWGHTPPRGGSRVRTGKTLPVIDQHLEMKVLRLDTK